MEVSLILPLGYNVPEKIKHSSPEILAALFDCMEIVLNSFSIRLDSDFAIQKLNERHEHELIVIKDHFVQRLNEQKKKKIRQKRRSCVYQYTTKHQDT